VSEPKQYTTAIIAAVPAENDPIHQVVAEDAHVTLQFLGEAADLTEDQITEIKTSLEMLASVVYPFEADISGTGELGPNKAQILIIQSALLTKIREMLGLTDAVSTAVAASEQFPNWIPHLTLAYEGEMPSVDDYKTVTIGSIELWLAEEHHVFELSRPKPVDAVTAAGAKVFEEGLHPRGADGRFIEKFGVIKYLTGLGWQYGKVEGIYHDEHSGAVKLTVTPSDLSGKTSGASIVLSPKQVYRAPTSKAHLPVNAVGTQKIGGQAGSNQGGLYKIHNPVKGPASDSGSYDEFYVKKPKTKSHGNNEALANALYEEAGVPVPEVDYHPDGQLYSKIVKGQQDMAQQLNNEEWTDQVRRNFAVDAWLGNRDVFGMTYDNILTDEHGVPWRIDNGGALLYRAMGEKKTDFGGKVTELDAFRTGKKAKIYGPGMTKAQEIDGAERVLAISPQQIDEMVSEHGLPKSLADTLKARRAYIASYYGLPLPESQSPAEAEGPTSAPLLDPPDIAENNGKSRNWFKSSLTHLGFLGQAGDLVEFPDGSTQMLGVDETGNALSIVGEQAQLLGFIQQHGPDAQVFLKKSIDPAQSRPEHGSKLVGSDLTSQRWKRGDEILDDAGAPFKVLGWNDSTGAMLVQFASKPPLLLDTKGKDANGLWTVNRWDPPAVDTAPIQTEQQAIDIVADPFEVQPITPGTPDEPVTTLPAEDFEYVPPAQAGKTGQAAQAEAAIKADLDTPLPSGNGQPAPSKTTAPGGAKTMVIGDGTEAATGDSVTSKKDGKTYTFVKPKGQYAVVTDPNGEDPKKQLLKLASTMTQPGKVPAGDVEVEAPKTATGEVPALGMMAVAKDGWAGEITLISPDGKFVFITDANGKRKRKSTGTVSITSAPAPVGGGDAPSGDATNNTPPPAVPKAATTAGPLKDYGPGPANLPAAKAALGDIPFDLDDPADLDAGDMVVVGYADGSIGLEPYNGQPLDSLLTNTTGKVATHNTITTFKGTVESGQLVKAAATKNNQYNWDVVWNGHLMVTNGTAGPSGGLLLWDISEPETYALEIPGGQNVTLLNSLPAEQSLQGNLPDPAGIPSAQMLTPDMGFWAPVAPLYGDEAKTLGQWASEGNLAVGAEISVDGKNWLKVTHVFPNGSVYLEDDNGAVTGVPSGTQSTWVLKAPALADGNQPDPAFAQPSPEVPGIEDLPMSTPGKKKIGDLVQGDVVTDANGDTTIIDSVSTFDPSTQQVHVKVMGEDWGSPADPNFEMTHHGNLTENPVDVPAGLIAPHLYPGSTLQFNSAAVPAQVVSYPELQDNGSYKVAVMQDGDPDNLALVTIGEWNAGVDISNEAILTASLGTFTTPQAAGVDADKINALFNASKVESQSSVDHHAQMTDQGVPFGTAVYPIYFNEPSGTYFRAGHSGLQEWDSEGGTWNNVFGTVEGKEKVWDGVPFYGSLEIPEGFPDKIMADPEGTAINYKPQPGETIQAAKVAVGGQQQTVLISYPAGLDGPAHVVMGGGGPSDGEPHVSATPFQSGWKDSGVFAELTTIHDPFADTAAVDMAPITHHEGPQPPTELGQTFQAKGYTPEPGQTFWVAKTNTGAVQALVKQDDGTYRKILYNGHLGATEFTPETLKNYELPGYEVTHYTWTYLPEGADAPATVQGLPDGFAPYVPGDGQSVLKVTLPNGKQNVYVQKQPGAGWYEMGPDGVVLENSDAVKSDFIVQQKLAGKGSQAATYELLHPLPEGAKSTAAQVPTFTNNTGDWTPDPHQSVVSLVSGPGDPDPWFFVQDTPGGSWVASPNSPHTGTGEIDDDSMQLKLANQSLKTGGYQKVYDGQSGQAALDAPGHELPPSFEGYTPQPGEKVLSYTAGPTSTYFYLQKPGEKNWHSISDGEVSDHWAIYANDVPENLGPEFGNDYKLEWPPEAPSAPEAGGQTFGGYTPAEGDTVFQEPDGTFWVKTAADGKYHAVQQSGALSKSSMSQEDWDLALTPGTQQVWPAGGAAATTAPAGIFGGYQTEPGDAVVQLEDGGAYYVKKADANSWQKVNPDGTLGEADAGFSQDTMEWAAGEYGLTELQGTLKPGAPVTPDPLPTSGEAYAGVADHMDLDTTHFDFPGYAPSQAQWQRIYKLKTLEKGQSLYVLEDSSNTIESSAVVVRNSDGSWHTVLSDGSAVTFMVNDEDFEHWAQANHYTVHKAQFGAPKAAPAPVSTGPKAQLSGWQNLSGMPSPEAFSYLSDPTQGMNAKAGDYVFVQSGSIGATGGGIVAQLKEDWDGSGTFTATKVAAVDAGGVIGSQTAWIDSAEGFPFTTWNDENSYYISAQLTPTTAPAAAPAAPSAPSPVPSYPGQHKPSQEDINSWGGELTKDGHIPTPGMFVTGKGPMSGKIIGVSKDKSKATVLTTDGKKTTRLISALKTDASANYSAYAAPVTAKDIPQGMPLAVDTVAEALQKTAQDGKFRAILNGHPGVSGGQMVVTKTTAPSGKVFNRVHLTLTPDQREQLIALLSGTGEKGDWVKASKLSDQVAIGDKLPMRKSSTDNPDGTPRWKVDSAITPPTHEVIGVTDDPSGSGVKIVTLKNIGTGEEITSRFHPGKSLTVYNWDPNKPKTMTAGAFSLSEQAKAAGWQFVTDGGISAIKGGAENGKLYNEPGTAVTKSALGQVSHSWKTLRNVSADGVVIETVDPKGSPAHSTTGVTVVSVPQGVDETALGAALAKLGIDYRPMTQDDAKNAVRGTLRTLLSLDTSDVDTAKGWTDEKLFAQAGKTMGISDLGWQDVLVGVDESTGKTSFFWSDRARNALAKKAKYNVVYRAATTANADQIVSTVKYGSASSILKKTAGMLDGSGHVGNGASASSDNSNHAGHGSYASASSHTKLPASNKFASYKTAGMMIYHRPEAVLGRIMDYRVANHDAFGMGHGTGSDHLAHATSMPSVKDYFLGGGLPTEAVGFIAVSDASERTKAIAQLKADGFEMINGRPVEDIIITKQKAATLSPDDLPPVTNPANARPILDLPTSYDAPAPAGGGVTAAATEEAA
jgi:2'-5' RNA ligase